MGAHSAGDHHRAIPCAEQANGSPLCRVQEPSPCGHGAGSAGCSATVDALDKVRRAAACRRPNPGTCRPSPPHPLTTIVHTVLQNRVTPLHFAAQQGHFKTVQALLEAGARLNALDTVRARAPLRRVTVDAKRCPCNAPASLRTCAALRAVWPDSLAHGSRAS